MVWEVMILSLYSKKLSFMSLLLHWPHWLNACCRDLWAAGKKAGGRLGDKSKTYWGRTDDIPRTVLRGHMFRDGTTSLEPPLNLIYQVHIAHWKNIIIWFTSQFIWNKHSKYQIHMILWTITGLLILQCSLQETKLRALCVINYCSQVLLILGY